MPRPYNLEFAAGAMRKTIDFLKPMLAVALAVGAFKLFWTWVGRPEILIEVHSLGILSFAGSLFLTLRIAADDSLRIRHLWLGNILFFGFCQILDTTQWLYATLSIHPAVMTGSGGATIQIMQAPLVQQLWVQLITWALIAPTLVTFVSGAPVIWLRRYAERLAE